MWKPAIDVMTAFFQEKNLKRQTGPLGESTSIFESFFWRVRSQCVTVDNQGQMASPVCMASRVPLRHLAKTDVTETKEFRETWERLGLRDQLVQKKRKEKGRVWSPGPRWPKGTARRERWEWNSGIASAFLAHEPERMHPGKGGRERLRCHPGKWFTVRTLNVLFAIWHPSYCQKGL